jgi:alpha/beta hydrolase family protein
MVMQTRPSSWRTGLLLVTSLLGAGACARGVRSDTPASMSVGSSALVLERQGSFAVGGSVVTSPGTFDPRHPSTEGGTLHGDHAYVFYQVPVDARPLPLVFWHGAGQSSKTWETTPDGREGFQNLFLRRRFSVYLLDQPRRGDAGRSSVPSTVPATTDDQIWFGMFRIGVWPDYFPAVQFSRDPEALNQFFRSMTPNTGPFDAEVNARAVAALFEKIGAGVLVTHSQGGGPGWLTVMKSPQVRAVVSYEPGSGFVFPQGEQPAPMSSLTGPLEAVGVPLEQFMALTKIPIVVYFGDNIPEKPSANPGQDNWRVRLAMARLWRDAINRHGGDVSVVELPAIGIHGNTHFAFSDLNNVQIADLLSNFLAEKQLDGSGPDQRTITSSREQVRKSK